MPNPSPTTYSTVSGPLFGGRLGPVGGVEIGAVGTGVFAGFRLAAGDDFYVTPSRWHGRNPTGRYSHSAVSYGFRRTNSSDAAMYIDPAFRGARSTAQADLGVDCVSVADSVLTLTARTPSAELVPYLPTTFTGGAGDAENRPRLITGSIKTAPNFMLSAAADFIVDTKLKCKAGAVAGYWPSFWTTTFFWPDMQELDVIEIRKNGSTTRNSTAINGSTTDGGANSVTEITPDYVIPTDRYVWYACKKSGGSVHLYDDVATEGVLAWRATLTHAKVGRFRGVHDIRLDLAVSNNWDSTTFSAAPYPAHADYQYWRAWVPESAALPAVPPVVLDAVNTTPGGSWAASLPATASLSGGAAGLEQVYGGFDNIDAPGFATRSSSTKLPGGLTANLGSRTTSGTVPTTEGGRVFVILSFAFDDGSPARCAILPFNVAPAVQGSLFANQSVSNSAAVSLTVAFADFHSGNLGPHTYTASVDNGAWLSVSGNGTGTLSLSGTAPASGSSVATVTINCTNIVGQTTTVARTITVGA